MADWKSGQFRDILQCVAKQYTNCHVAIVNEAYATRTCGRCGIARDRVDGTEYLCPECGWTWGRDWNGARNILLRWLTKQYQQHQAYVTHAFNKLFDAPTVAEFEKRSWELHSEGLLDSEINYARIAVTELRTAAAQRRAQQPASDEEMTAAHDDYLASTPHPNTNTNINNNTVPERALGDAPLGQLVRSPCGNCWEKSHFQQRKNTKAFHYGRDRCEATC